MRAAIVFVLVLPAFVMLAGCASGVRMTDEERVTCRDAGCSVWTDAELLRLVNKAGADGYRKGWTDATVQGGRDL